jgi:hypothetical protein
MRLVWLLSLSPPSLGTLPPLSSPAYVSIRQHTSAYVTAYVSMREHPSAYVTAYVSIRHSIRQHTSASMSMREHA